MRILCSPSLLSSTVFPFKYSSFRYTVYLSEARKRLIYVGLCLLLAFSCAYTERVALMYLTTLSLQQVFPIKTKVENARNDEINISTLPSNLSSIYQDGGVRLIFTDVEEAFYTFLSVSLFWCLLVSFPVAVYQIWCFLQPGVHAWKSRRVRTLLLEGVFVVYLLLWVVNRFLLPRLLSFFYSFEIERSSICLHAETKILSYVSLYVFINCISVLLCLCTILWRLYAQREILIALHSVSSFSEKSCSWRKRSRSSFAKHEGLSLRYQKQRSKLWWGCLLLSSLVSPPEISSQLACALLLIFLNEVCIWLAYTSACRALHSGYVAQRLQPSVCTASCALAVQIPGKRV